MIEFIKKNTAGIFCILGFLFLSLCLVANFLSEKTPTERAHMIVDKMVYVQAPNGLCFGVTDKGIPVNVPCGKEKVEKH